MFWVKTQGNYRYAGEKRPSASCMKPKPRKANRVRVHPGMAEWPMMGTLQPNPARSAFSVARFRALADYYRNSKIGGIYMQIYQNMPRKLVDGWPTEMVSHEAEKQFPFHYHEFEEWLEVMEGKITFFSAGRKPYELSKGEALYIPPGEVHRVQVGPEGVKYNMWWSVQVPDEDFMRELDAEDLSLIDKNLKVPSVEDSEDRAHFKAFFDEFLSEKLVFHTAGGQLVTKNAFRDRKLADFKRIPSDSVRVLHKSSESIFVSTAIHTESKAGGSRQSYSNLRLFVREKDMWKCSVWLNYREPIAS
jgi:mannose-6-phosphate isomerase-like protein (cupin superfamily)